MQVLQCFLTGSRYSFRYSVSHGVVAGTDDDDDSGNKLNPPARPYETAAINSNALSPKMNDKFCASPPVTAPRIFAPRQSALPLARRKFSVKMIPAKNNGSEYALASKTPNIRLENGRRAQGAR